RARKDGLFAPSDDWSEEEIHILREWYAAEGSNVITRLPGKSRNAVRLQANRLGLACKARWSEEEDAILRQYYPTEGSAVSKRFTDRSRESVRIRALKLGIRCK
ncbi:MAG: hypothetical protein LUD12_02175, partial [Lachnospiraceae bacterium]|nr:hypothetical protein [Lachnospiraceae bacterium]